MHIKKNKRITIDKLAIMIAKGFSDMHERFEAIDKRFENVDGRLEGIEGRLTKLDRGQEEIKLRMGNLAPSFEVVELKRRVNTLEGKTKN